MSSEKYHSNFRFSRIPEKFSLGIGILLLLLASACGQVPVEGISPVVPSTKGPEPMANPAPAPSPTPALHHYKLTLFGTNQKFAAAILYRDGTSILLPTAGGVYSLTPGETAVLESSALAANPQITRSNTSGSGDLSYTFSLDGIVKASGILTTPNPNYQWSDL